MTSSLVNAFMNKYTSGVKQELPNGPLIAALLTGVILASFLMMLRRLLHLEGLVMTDSLTGLPNRRALDKMLDRELERARHYHRTIAVLFLDLDGFKLINDKYNHSVGDAALREFAGVVRSSLRRNDILGRWGEKADEFLVILPKTDEVEAQQVVERIRTTLARRLLISGSDSPLTCSIGIATFPFSAQEREPLITAADHAMYSTKRQADRQKYSAPTTDVSKPESLMLA